MTLGDDEVSMAEGRTAELREAGHAVAARYDRRHRHLVVTLHTGVMLTVPVHIVQGLADAAPRRLSDIEISPTGLGLHWPQLDADVYVPALSSGVSGSAQWMSRLGTEYPRSSDADDASRRARP